MRKLLWKLMADNEGWNKLAKQEKAANNDLSEMSEYELKNEAINMANEMAVKWLNVQNEDKQ